MTPIDLKDEAEHGRRLLTYWKLPPREINRIIMGWKERARIYNARLVPKGNTADEIELRFVDKFRYDPEALVSAIMADPVAGDRVRDEILGAARKVVGHERAAMSAESVGFTDGAANLFERIAAALKRRTLGSGRLQVLLETSRTRKRAQWRQDVATRNWLRPWFHNAPPLDPVPADESMPLCLLNNEDIKLVFGPWEGMADNAIRTAIGNWKLPRPPLKQRKKLSASAKHLLINCNIDLIMRKAIAKAKAPSA